MWFRNGDSLNALVTFDIYYLLFRSVKFPNRSLILLLAYLVNFASSACYFTIERLINIFNTSCVIIQRRQITMWNEEIMKNSRERFHCITSIKCSTFADQTYVLAQIFEAPFFREGGKVDLYFPRKWKYRNFDFLIDQWFQRCVQKAILFL